MKLGKDKVTFLLGIIASILLFVVGGLFNNVSYILGCYTFLGLVLTVYTILAFFIPSTQKSRDFVFSYGVTTACMFVISLMFHIIITDSKVKSSCRYNNSNCAHYVLISVCGFASTFCFLAASVMTFKVLRVW
ncbi:conserved Plasmodium protein, unknown function [Plasmodium knowlesi strain H]|uniref:MARVEL domain-containing protein n=3 Tax=Plasmodium knowlesi TaxID=5850 RepID=A0A5K1UII5_PLAKH|nr:conserved Plasmodium protein, unknown function [Plasmodium knowlesi strain H]OTN65040.1 Uncharacterized protein PKNOH_S120121900 [Plasmodium knowlesi]CAA9988085.1 conserved Plasmodium protein, unknown function [Plasmodium knowlesi strain H]SBO19947.1 conserved Plasmodium protein, unknown function [Plasmodium knowlesi strain H]SBO29089.1 conserved Plasmodium protein, unknown function [Plasmodium knowlesi strain H]VVS77559.1 conserved Plasmodium protein, unknown function [Plasmodium knowlesi |eukprot:XP_002259059.1 hypothetical protein, conserved in Plasmodium species [Plasmodium knowlesi strain H]